MSRGFVLLTSLVVTLLVSGMTALILTEVLDLAALTEGAGGSLQALHMAEEGVDLARREMQGRPLNELLLGENGTAECLGEAGWRNPLSFSDARRRHVEGLLASCDDGRLGPFEPAASEGSRAGKIMIRISNNREEDPAVDDDRLLVVRSLAVVPRAVARKSAAYHHVSMVEAQLERMSWPLPREPLSFWADDGEVDVCGGAVQLVNPEAGDVGIWEEEAGSFIGDLPEILLHPAFSGSASPDVRRWVRREQVGGESGVWQSQWWLELLENVSELARSPGTEEEGPGLFWYPQGGSLRGEIEGLLVTAGDLILEENSRLEGLLLHLGKGRLTLEPRTQIEGAVWMLNPWLGPGEIEWGEVRLQLCGPVLIHWDRSAVEKALRYMPLRIRAWRILFPEMQLEN